MNDIFDPGLQPERTELAWRRTSLAMAVGSLVAMRLLPTFFDDALWSLVGVAGLVAAAVLWIAARQRSRETLARLATGGDRTVMPGAAMLATTAAVTGVIGLAALAAVLVGVLV